MYASEGGGAISIATRSSRVENSGAVQVHGSAPCELVRVSAFSEADELATIQTAVSKSGALNTELRLPHLELSGYRGETVYIQGFCVDRLATPGSTRIVVIPSVKPQPLEDANIWIWASSILLLGLIAFLAVAVFRHLKSPSAHS